MPNHVQVQSRSLPSLHSGNPGEDALAFEFGIRILSAVLTMSVHGNC